MRAGGRASEPSLLRAVSISIPELRGRWGKSFVLQTPRMSDLASTVLERVHSTVAPPSPQSVTRWLAWMRFSRR